MDTGPDSSYQHNQDGLIITAVVMTVIASTFVLMRSASRFVVIRNPGLDDYFMLAAMTLTICYVIMLFVLRHNHVGFPSSTLSADNLSAFIKTTLAIQVLYYTNVFCIKTSILLTYLRFAVTRTFRLLCLGTIFLHAIFFFICFVVTLAQCRPLYKMWTPFADGKCINTTAFFYSTSAFNIITDIWILCLPFRTLRKIQRPRRERVALYLIFSVGAFAATASIVRLHTIYIYTLSDDPSRDGIQVNLWSMIELTVAISCASVPALKPLFSRSQRAATRASRSKTFSTTTGSARSTSQGHYIHPGSSEPHVYPYSYEPPQAYEARQAYLEAHPDQNETTEKPTTTSAVCSPSSTTPAGGLSFFSPTTPAAAAAGLSFFSSASDEKDLEKEKEREKPHRPPLFDRENDHTESSGLSLGLPLQQPLQPPPPVKRTPSKLSIPPYSSTHHRPAADRAVVTVPPPTPQPRFSTSQVSLGFQGQQPQQQQRGAPSRTPSQGSLSGKPPIPIPVRRSSSQQSIQAEKRGDKRPGPPSRTGSQKSVTFDDGWPFPPSGSNSNNKPKGLKGLEGNGSQGSFYIE